MSAVIHNPPSSPENSALLLSFQLGTEGRHPDSFSCASPRCQARRERHHKPGPQQLFSAEWREMKIAGRIIWVVDITARCPDCDRRQTHTLIPPTFIPIDDGASQ